MDGLDNKLNDSRPTQTLEDDPSSMDRFDAEANVSPRDVQKKLDNLTQTLEDYFTEQREQWRRIFITLHGVATFGNPEPASQEKPRLLEGATCGSAGRWKTKRKPKRQRSKAQNTHEVNEVVDSPSQIEQKDCDTIQQREEACGKSTTPLEETTLLPLPEQEPESFEAIRRTSTIVDPEGGFARQRGAYIIDGFAMKQEIHNTVCDLSELNSLYATHGLFQSIARHRAFEAMSMSAIALNAIWIAVEADMNDVAILSNAHPVFQVGEHTFCAWFLCEVIIRFFAYKAPRYSLQDRWFLFDAALAMIMVLETWIMLAILSATSTDQSNAAGSTALFSIIRFARFLRMARIAKLISSCFELVVLLKGLKVACRSVFYTLLLTAIVIYVFSVGFISLLKGTELEKQYFDTLPLSMWNLCLVGILPDQSDLANALLNEDGGGIVPAFGFIVFCVATGLTLMNMLVGVICEVVTIVSDVEKERMEVEYASRNVEDVFYSVMDRNHDGRLSKDEFAMIVGDEKCVAVLGEIGVDIEDVLECRDVIYEEAAKTSVKDDGRLSFKNFMQALLKLRGHNHATVRDIITLRKTILQRSALEGATCT
eukprot:TRINITY_DN28712_c0_g1_i1.p1 TRINITY_DN28712_c0_g1~~TRINITY_DN28712_c0_g1_i1.p1  ORF type:complete len:596 (-),score=66.51 TRINITY_DN28712_c0_g1_i1:200-1987(-)